MIKVDPVFVNHLEKLSCIQLNEHERKQIILELTEQFKLFGDFEPLMAMESPISLKKPLPLDRLREDVQVKNHFPFFMNVPEHAKGYVIV